uniref:Uncharacterized protein n=1 Tax=viral metagenome TaxID=1070528 RepID=A0A6H1ZFM5_9ZZZZ
MPSKELNEREEEWAGLDTIRGLVGEPPDKIKVPFKVMKKQQMLLYEWNPLHIAIIPYCYKCKEVLVWHRYHTGGILFHCPKCRREWIEDEDWNKTGGSKNEK